MIRNPDLAHLERDGVILPGVLDFSTPDMARDYRVAMDAQPAMNTTGNSGIPAWFSTYIDPQVIKVAFAPMKATEIMPGGEQKKGDWTTTTAQFPVLEYSGEISSYGDWNNNGSIGANFQFVPRQSYYYQTMTRWGERELETVGLAKINYKNELDMAGVNALNRFQNKSYFYGISGLMNYGLLNEPNLPATLTPVTKAAGGTSWSAATMNEIYADVQAMYVQLVTQTKGLVEMDSPMTLATSPQTEAYLANPNIYGISARMMLEKSFPGLQFKTAPEYATTGGNLAQMIAHAIDGQETGYTAFTEKLRAHAIVVETSAWKQKKSQGTWGAIIKQPLAFAQMLGV